MYVCISNSSDAVDRSAARPVEPPQWFRGPVDPSPIAVPLDVVVATPRYAVEPVKYLPAPRARGSLLAAAALTVEYHCRREAVLCLLMRRGDHFHSLA